MRRRRLSSPLPARLIRSLKLDATAPVAAICSLSAATAARAFAAAAAADCKPGISSEDPACPATRIWSASFRISLDDARRFELAIASFDCRSTTSAPILTESEDSAMEIDQPVAEAGMRDAAIAFFVVSGFLLFVAVIVGGLAAIQLTIVAAALFLAAMICVATAKIRAAI